MKCKSRYSSPTVFALGAALVLTACSGSSVKETLGLGREAPDEFRVVSRPPLSVPPQFELRPPSTGGEASGNALPARDKAASLVLGEDAAPEKTLEQKQRDAGADTAVPVVSESPLSSNSEEKFLNNIGAVDADPAIREKLHQERRDVEKIREDAGFLEKLSPSKMPPKDPTVDAKGEADRIRANKDAGKPVTEGETPVIKPSKSVLGNIFGKDE